MTNGLTRREFLKATAASAGAVALTQLVNPLAAEAAAACLWGAYPDPSPGCETDGCGPEDYMPAVYDFETLIGRKIGMTRHYPRWDYPVPNSVIKESRRTGHIPLISWRPQLLAPANTWLNWIDIANGVHDQRIDAVAAALKAWNRSAYFVFHHEPENAFRHGHCGTQAQFALAYDHIRSRFDAIGATRMKWVCTLQRVTYDGANGGANAWFPDAADLVGVDGYNRGSCSGDKTWKSFESLFTTARNFAVARGSGMVIEEWGCVENDPTDCGVSGVSDTKANWILAAGNVIKSWPEVKAVIYTHSLASFKSLPVDFRVNSSSEALAAYKQVGSMARFN